MLARKGDAAHRAVGSLFLCELAAQLRKNAGQSVEEELRVNRRVLVLFLFLFLLAHQRLAVAAAQCFRKILRNARRVGRIVGFGVKRPCGKLLPLVVRLAVGYPTGAQMKQPCFALIQHAVRRIFTEVDRNLSQFLPHVLLSFKALLQKNGTHLFGNQVKCILFQLSSLLLL